jgi:hypothetical protein
MKTSRIASTLALVTLTACSVRSKAPANEGISFQDSGIGDGPDETDASASSAAHTSSESPSATDAGGLADAGPSVDAGETSIDAGSADAGEHADAATDAGPPGANIPRARGFYVYSVDYNNSLSIGAVGVDGSILSKSLLSSGSDVPGLSLPLGTDAVPATQVQSGDDLIVIDRTNHAIDWLSLSAEVTNQVGVGLGDFAANPYDYLQVSPELGFVSRYETNAAPGNAEYDESGDLLAINPETKQIVGRVDFNYLAEEVEGLQPRPTKMVAYDGKIYVVLGMLDSGFTPLTDSLLAQVDPNTLEVTATLGLGLTNCEDISMAPQGGLVAIVCKGGWADVPVTVNSGIVLVDLTKAEPSIATTYGAADLAEAAISTLSFASETSILFSSYGSTYPTVVPDRAFTLDLTDGSVSEPVLEAGAYQLGHIRCAAEQSVCVVANADTFAVEFFDVEEGGVSHNQTVEFDADLGLPPRYIGVF